MTRSVLGSRSGLSLLRRTTPDVTAIFLWHSVGSRMAPVFDRNDLAADRSSHCSVDAFAAHINWIQARFRIVSLDDALDAAQDGSTGTGWIAALTFDDGFRNVVEEAVPWLASRGLPSTIFVNAALANGDDMKDFDLGVIARQDPALASRPRAEIAQITRAYATWDLLRSLPTHVTFGNHGARHLRAATLTQEEAEREIDGGLDALARELGVTRPAYAFPYGQPGDISDLARTVALRRHRCVLSAYGGCTWPGGRAGDIPRVPVFSSTSPALLTEYTFPPRFLTARMSGI